MSPPNQEMIFTVGGYLAKSTQVVKNIPMHAKGLIPKR
jgi:hypothetical protein